MKHMRNRWILVWAASLVLAACENDVSPITIALQSEYQGVLEAISQSNQPLSEKLALIEASQRDGLADNQTAIKMIRQAVASLGGTLEEKLDAISAAVQSQTTGLETKLALIEAAVTNGFADIQAQLTLLQQALASLSGTLDEKLAAVEAAVKVQEMDFATKLNLIEAAIQGGFADSAAAQALIAKAIDSFKGTKEEKLTAINTAVSDTTTALSAKMSLIETAVKGGFAEASAQQALIKTAVSSLNGPIGTKLAAIEAAVASQTTSLETKLALIETAVENLGDQMENLGLGLVKTALSSLSGTLDTKLTTIEAAVNSQTTGFSSKLALIETALSSGFTDESTALGLVQTALGALKTQLDNVDDGLSDAIDDVSTAFSTLSTNINVDMALSDILSAIQGLPDYGAILAAIQNTLAELRDAIIPFRLKYVGDKTLTTAAGGEWRVVFQVEPADSVISASRLKLDILSKKQFFPTWGTSTTAGESPVSYYVTAVVADPSVAGQYVAIVTCLSPDVVWDESTVSLSVAYGKTENPKFATTESFDLVMIPKVLKGLKYWTYPAATFTFKRHGSINNIYYSLDSGVFETQDESDTRTYTAAFIDSVQFIPVNDSIAPEFIQLDTEKRMIVFIPDTAGITYTQFWPDKDPSDRGGWRLWHNFKDSSGVKNESVLGKLVLTDRWHVKDTIHNFKIGWYNAWWFPESAIVRVDEIQDDNTAVVDIRSLLSKLGLSRSWLDGRFILQEQYGDLDGPYFKMSAQLLPETLKLAVKFQADPIVGTKFGLTAHHDLWIFPTETDPQFKVLALSFSYSLVVTIVN